MLNLLHLSNIASSWAGGEKGREVLDRLIPVLSKKMSSTGLLYLVAIEENDPEDICQQLVTNGFKRAQVISFRKAYNEKLMIIRADMNAQD